MEIVANENNEMKHLISVLTEEEKKKLMEQQKESDTLEYITE